MMKNKRKQKSTFWIIILLGLLFSCVVPNVNADFLDENSSEILISSNVALNEEPAIGVHKGNIHIVWAMYPTEFSSVICYRKSQDNGRTWGDIYNLSSNTTKAVYPDIAVSKNKVHVVWSDYRSDNPEIFYIRSMDNGENWGSQQRLTFNSSQKNNIYDIRIKAEDSNVYVIWKDYRSGSSEIFFKKSTNNGEAWGDDQRLTTDYDPSYYPRFTVQNNKLFVVYEHRSTNYNIALIKSEDYGDSWSTKKLLTDTHTVSEKPYIAVLDDSIFLVWQEITSFNREIMFKKSTNNGDSWEDEKQIASASYLTIDPKIYVYQNKIAVIWHEQHNDSFSIVYITSDDVGSNWNERREIVSHMDCYSGEIAGEGSNLYLVWQQRHQAAWSDVWFIGNHTYSEVIDSTVVNSENNNTSGFELILIFIPVVIVLITSCLYHYTKKRRC